MIFWNTEPWNITAGDIWREYKLESKQDGILARDQEYRPLCHHTITIINVKNHKKSSK